MKNQSREFATMSDDERRRFALEQETDAEVTEVEFADDAGRDPDRVGRHYQRPADEYADPEHRDGAASQLDDEQHDRGVEKSRGRRPPSP